MSDEALLALSSISASSASVLITLKNFYHSTQKLIILIFGFNCKLIQIDDDKVLPFNVLLVFDYGNHVVDGSTLPCPSGLLLFISLVFSF